MVIINVFNMNDGMSFIAVPPRKEYLGKLPWLYLYSFSNQQSMHADFFVKQASTQHPASEITSTSIPSDSRKPIHVG